ncbi:DUF3892 domain-containing protein [Paenibacillus sp. RC67]|uniref:DUF3892 domain-containing protein n=1 Tax=Paenibacillus sp. RC67 TaxID=3039392 RepID=UPI0024AD8B35|nr:DUF3892 domain-containing protein [Paenibacillus sp. RC67]
MSRRRRGPSYPPDTMSVGLNGGTTAWNGMVAATSGKPTDMPYSDERGYDNAVESTHNGNFAWNGQPIPQYARLNQNGPAQGGTPYIPQTQSAGTQTFSGGQMPVPGSSGDPRAEYGQRNTGINNADARTVGFQGGYAGYGPNGQPLQYGTFMRDGTQYGRGPHTIDPSKKIITAVRYSDGGISAVKFQDGSVADIAQAIGMAEADMIEDVNTGKNREGQKTLRSYPDGDPSNNLSNLPRF